MKKLALAAFAAISALATAGAASATTAYDFVIFKNNTTETFTRTAQSMSGGTWQTTQPSPNPSGGTKSGYFSQPAGTTTYYSDTWKAANDDTTCSYSIYTTTNSYGNQQSYVTITPGGTRAGTVKCTGPTPPSTQDGSWNFNYAVSF